MIAQGENDYRGYWRTPDILWEWLIMEFGEFDWDICASPDNAKCENYFTDENPAQGITGLRDAFTNRWEFKNGFGNPPFSMAFSFFEKADLSATLQRRRGQQSVWIAPSSFTGNKWYHGLVHNYLGELDTNLDEIIDLAGARVNYDPDPRMKEQDGSPKKSGGVNGPTSVYVFRSRDIAKTYPNEPPIVTKRFWKEELRIKNEKS